MKFLTAALRSAPVAVLAASLAAAPAALAAPAGAGDLDHSFGSGGIALDRLPHDGQMSLGSAQLLHDDGRTVVMGDIMNGPLIMPGLMRYRSDGRLDRSFGHEGKVATSFGKRVSVETAGVVATKGGGYLVSATRNTGTSEQSAYSVVTLRYSADGRFDTAYGKGGMAVVPLPQQAIARSMTADPQGRPLVAVSTANERGESGAVLRLRANGGLDGTYGTAGVAELPGSDPVRVTKLTVDTAGRAVVAGTAFRPEPGTETTRQVVSRFTSDGRTDTTFGDQGRATSEVGLSNAGTAVTVDAQDRPVVAGYAIDENTNKADFSVVRYRVDGTRDATFARNGVARYSVTEHDDTPAGIACDHAGRIVVAGTQWRDLPDPALQTPGRGAADLAPRELPAAPTMQERSGFEVSRLLADGSLDPSFGTAGRTHTQIQAGAAAMDVATSPRHGIQVVGFSFDTDLTYSFTTVRYQD